MNVPIPRAWLLGGTVGAAALATTLAVGTLLQPKGEPATGGGRKHTTGTTASTPPAAGEEQARERWWFDDSIVDRALRRARDAYLVTIEIEAEGHSYDKKTYGNVRGAMEDWKDWRYGKKRFVAHLVPAGGVTAWNVTSIKADLIDWIARVDRQLAQLEQTRTYGGPMLAFAKEQERVVRVADDLTDEVSRILGLLYSVEIYGFRPAPHREKEVRISRDPRLEFEEGSWRSRTRREFRSGEVEERSSNGVMYPFGASNALVLAADAASGPALESARHAQLLLWSFDREDYESFARLLARFEQVDRALTFDPARIEREKLGMLASRQDLTGLYEGLHREFRDPFRLAVRAVVRLAALMSPRSSSTASFPAMREELSNKALLRDELPREPLNLPPRTTTLALLSIPLSQLTEDSRAWVREKGDPRTGEWYVLGPGADPTDAEGTTLQVVPEPGSTHRLDVRDTGVYSLVGAVGDSRSLSGAYVMTLVKQQKSTDDDGKADYLEQATATTRVRWRIEHDPGEASPADEPMVLAFTRRIGDRYVQFDQPVVFGEPFWVEGKMSSPAQRPVYRVKLQAPNGENVEVFLRPTEEDRSLLRSEMHYLMWNVEEFDDSPSENTATEGVRR